MSEARLLAVVDEFARLFAAGFGDLAFADHPVLLRTAGAPLAAVRFELTHTDYFHLQSVRLLAYQSEDEAPLVLALDDAEVAFSSCYRDADHLGSGRALVDNEGGALGFHTALQEAPWATLTFPVPVSCDAIEVLNRNDDYACRARSLRIWLSYAGQPPQLVYDAAARRAEALACLLRIHVRTAGAFPGARYRVVENFVAHLLEWDFETCNALLQAHAWLWDLRAPLDTIARVYGRELTLHGVNKSFRFWTVDEKRSYLGFANEIVAALADLSDKVCFGFGFALGLVRDGDVIAHDDDVDILLAFDAADVATIAQGLAMAEQHLRAKGFTVDGSFLTHRWVIRETMLVDLFVGLVEAGGALGFYPARRGGYDVADIFPPRVQNYLDMRVAMPNDLLTYLDKTYGPAWRVPDNHFGHNWDPEEYRDIL